MSLSNIDNDLLELEKQLSALSLNYPQLARNAATAKINYEIAYADAYDQISHDAIQSETKLTVPEKEAKTLLRIKDSLVAKENADAELDAAKKQIDVLQSILMSTQSRVKLELIERGLTNYQT